MKMKRILAFFIDMMFVSFLSASLVLLPVFHYNPEEQNAVLNEYVDKILESGSADLDEDGFVLVMHDYTYKGISLMVVSTTITFLYFGILGFFFNGVTLGKKIMGIKIVPEYGDSLNPNLFILREILVNGLAFKVIVILITLLCKDVNSWYEIYNFVNTLSMVVMFAIYGFILFRDDERGLHDLICRTRVVKIEKNEIE